jgi:hypothetical protein
MHVVATTSWTATILSNPPLAKCLPSGWNATEVRIKVRVKVRVRVLKRLLGVRVRVRVSVWRF